MIRRPPRATRTDTLFPTRRSSDLVDRIFCAVDCGRVVNPDLVRQQIEGGIIFALSGAVAGGVTWSKGLPQQTALGDMGLPRMADAPEITVQIMESDAPPAGVSGAAVPPVAPAIAKDRKSTRLNSSH